MKYCRHCLYPVNHPLGLTFDEDGICSGCLIHEEKDQLDWDERLDVLKRITNGYRSTTRSIHDCIVPISGGRDSYFILHLVKNVLGMNPLLVNYNIHYNTNIGIRNLGVLRSKLSSDIMQKTVSPKTVKKITLQTIEDLGSIYWHILAGQTVFPVQVAVKYKIPLIIWGCHQGIDQVGMFSHLDEVEMTRKYRKDHDLMGIEAEDLLKMNNNLDEHDLHQYFYPHDAELSRVGVRGIYLNNYIRWDSRKQHEMMVDLYNYHTGLQQRTFDTYNDVDSLHYSGLHDYIKLLKHGYGKVTDHASREIRLKSMTRDQGINLVKKYEANFPKDIEIFSAWLGVDKCLLSTKLENHRNMDLWDEEENGSFSLKHSIVRFLQLNTGDKNEKSLDDWNDFLINNPELELSLEKSILIGRGWVDK